MRLKRSPSFKQDAGLQGSYSNHNYNLLHNPSSNNNADDSHRGENDDDDNVEESTNKQHLANQQHHSTSDDHHSSSSSDDDDDDESVDESAIETTLQEEIRIIVALSGQGIIAQLAWSVESFLVAAYIGRNFGSIHLDGYMLAMLSCNLTAYSLMEGIYSALDTLLAHAYGSKNYGEVQLLVVRCVIISMSIIIPFIAILAIYMNDILLSFGEDPIASQYATNWYRIYIFSVPFYILYHTTNSFLSAQYIVLPEVITALVSSVFLLPILVTSFGTYFGFLGTGVSIVVYQACQAFMMIGYVIWQQPHHPDTWPRPTNPNNQLEHFQSILKKAMKWRPFSKLLFLGTGGMLAESEWIYWEILSLMIGTLGLTQLSVHAISTQILTITFMIPLGICEAVEIRIANVLPQSSYQARKLSFYYSLCSSILFASISYIIYILRFWIYSIFTTELEVIDGCEEIWWEVCFFIFSIGILEVNAGIATALGMQWTMGLFTVIFLWCTSLPALYYYAIYHDGGLKMAWQCILPFYTALNMAIILRLVCCDWEALAIDIRKERGTKVEYEKLDSIPDISVFTYSNDINNEEEKQCIQNNQHVVDEEEAIVSLVIVSAEHKTDENGTDTGTYGSILKQHPKQC